MDNECPHGKSELNIEITDETPTSYDGRGHIAYFINLIVDSLKNKPSIVPRPFGNGQDYTNMGQMIGETSLNCLLIAEMKS